MTTDQIIAVKPIPRYHLDKHYKDMTRLEKRAYKRWLNKHDIWDGAEVVERMQRDKRLVFGRDAQ